MTSPNPNPIFEQAKQLFHQQRVAEALALLDTLAPEGNRNYLYVRARCLAELGRIDDAIACCERLRDVFDDPRGGKLGQKLATQERLPALAPSEAACARPEKRRSGWLLAVCGLATAAGLAALGILLSYSLGNLRPLLQGALAAAPEAVSANTATVTAAPPEVPKPSLSLKPRGFEQKLHVRGMSFDELTGADETPPPDDFPVGAMTPRVHNSLETQKPAAAVAPAPPPVTPAQPVETPPQAKSTPAPPVTAKSVIELQAFRTEQKIANARGDSACLTNLNPYIGAWYLVELNLSGRKTLLHLELPSFQGDPLRRPALSLYADGLAVWFKGEQPRRYPLWAGRSAAAVPDAANELNPDPVLANTLAPEGGFQALFTMICDGLVLVRAQKAGSTTKMEYATDLLRETRIGDWFVEKAKPYLIPAPETGEDHRADAAGARPNGDVYPQDAQVDESQMTLYSSPQNLGIETDAPDKKLFYGRWYKAVNHQHIFVSLMKPTLADKTILDSYPDRVGTIGSRDKKRREADALVYLIAFDMSHFRFGYALGATHPKLDWSPRATCPHTGPGPDGFDSRNPLCTIAAVPPYYAPLAAATFTGGFKREHGAFNSGPLAGVNKGSHFGFMEQGVVFSTLQPDLATIVITREGALDMLTWPKDGASLIPKLAHARQNCISIVEGHDANGISIPNPLVNTWGAGSWSGDQAGDFVTLRASAALQESGGQRFLVVAYFTGATPNAMARTFQAYRCRFAMLLDMNTPNYCYTALYKRDGSGKITGVECLHKDMAPSTGEDGVRKFLEKNDTRDFFYVLHVS